jgi:hypothetical protein
MSLRPVGSGIANIFVGRCEQLSQSVVAVDNIRLFKACLPCIGSGVGHASTPHRHHILVSLSFALIQRLVLRCTLLPVRSVRFDIFVFMKVTITLHPNQIRYHYIFVKRCPKSYRILHVSRRDVYRLPTTGYSSGRWVPCIQRCPVLSLVQDCAGISSAPRK